MRLTPGACQPDTESPLKQKGPGVETRIAQADEAANNAAFLRR